MSEKPPQYVDVLLACHAVLPGETRDERLRASAWEATE